MQKIDMIEGRNVGGRIWRDLGALAAEAAIVGVLFSLLLVVGVMMISRGQRNAEPASPATVTTVSAPVQVNS